VLYAHKLTTTRRALEKKQISFRSCSGAGGGLPHSRSSQVLLFPWWRRSSGQCVSFSLIDAGSGSTTYLVSCFSFMAHILRSSRKVLFPFEKHTILNHSSSRQAIINPPASPLYGKMYWHMPSKRVTATHSYRISLICLRPAGQKLLDHMSMVIIGSCMWWRPTHLGTHQVQCRRGLKWL